MSSSSATSSVPLPKFLTHPLPALHQKFRSINAHEAFLRRTAAASTATVEEQDDDDDDDDDDLELAQDAVYGHGHARNRYADIFPWPHNAVQLRCLADPYVNASRIALGRRGERLIATQGPLDEDGGEAHFWEMAWQERCEVVVMLTQAWEDGREKCCVYYPVDQGDVKDVEGWGTVQCVGLREEERTEVRELRVWKGRMRGVRGVEGEEDREGRGGREGDDGDGERERAEVEARTVWHFLFLGWPDYDIPVSPVDQNALLELIRMSRFRMPRVREQDDKEDEVDEDEDQEATPPRIVHCSAGVGRTGTFIALDHLLQELNDGKFDCLIDVDENDEDACNDGGAMAYPEDSDVDPVYETVKRLREQRMFMVGKPRQYAFIYQMLRERWAARKTDQQMLVMEDLSDGDESQAKKRRLIQDGSEDELGIGEKRTPDLN